MLKISFVHRLFLELTNEEYQMRLLSNSFAVCLTYSVRAEVTAMI